MYLSAMSLCQTSRQYGSAEFGTLGGGAGSAEEQTLAPWGLEVPNSVLPRTRLGTRGGTVSGTFGHENVKNYTPPRSTACVGGESVFWPVCLHTKRRTDLAVRLGRFAVLETGIAVPASHRNRFGFAAPVRFLTFHDSNWRVPDEVSACCEIRRSKL